MATVAKLSEPVAIEPPSGSADAWTIGASALLAGFRDRTIVWLSLLFMLMVLLSAYLGWSATHTIDEIYAKAAFALAMAGKPVPGNPVNETSPLAMLRNMTTYVALLGALVAIVIGGQFVTLDRRSGIFPLIVSRPVSRSAWAFGKLGALVVAIVGLLLVAMLVNVVTMLLLPGVPVTLEDWLGLAAFYGVSAFFLFAFGFAAIAAAAASRSETTGLLIPLTLWMLSTFVLPQLSANINPMAALNPISAMAAPPGGVFFDIVGPLLAPVSLTTAYRDIAAAILGFAPADAASRSVPATFAILVVADIVLSLAALAALHGLDPTRSDTDD